jgi:endonuclease/exonuclease/phosphatase family metal-dependent hydrolase
MERHRHVDQVCAFLRAEDPDIVCLQEVYVSDLIDLQRRLCVHASFAPMTIREDARPNDGVHAYEGVAILTRAPCLASHVHYYARSGDLPPVHHDRDRESPWQPLLSVTVPCRAGPLTVLTTHFMKSWDGKPDSFQRYRMQHLMHALAGHPSFVFCGDLNIPRGTELYQVLAARYHDNVPSDHTSSIDPVLHRVPGLRLMIDYAWSTPEWRIPELQMVEGVSDHKALVGHVVRAQQKEYPRAVTT